MTDLPAPYAWLVKEPGPKILTEFLRIYGTRERPGPANEAEIMAWAAEVGLRSQYSGDSIPWCGLAMAVVAHRAGWTDQIPDTPLWARSWAEFGERADRASLGDILVFARNGGGHVGVYVGEDATSYHVLGGNQSDAVTITRISKSRLLTARRPKWRMSEPANRRPIRLAVGGKLSTNEA